MSIDSEFSPTTWRLLVESAPRSGAANMAVDQALADGCAAGDSPPTLRFYRWSPPAISLGRHQPLADVDRAAAAHLGYNIVRRSTGGRAILHTDELTYSVAAPADEPRVQGAVMDAYLRLSGALLCGLQGLGLGVADKAPGHVRAGKDVSAACFEVPSAYEITALGRKLMGSAQSRRAGAVLQHGSLPLIGDVTRLVDVLALPVAERTALRAQLSTRATTLSAALGVAPEAELVRFETVAAALVAGFAQTLNLRLEPGELSAREVGRVEALMMRQFGNVEWTEKT